MKKDYFYALYDKEDQCIGVYDSLEEAIWKVFGINKKEKKAYWKIYLKLHNSILKTNNFYYKGFWYKYHL